MCYLSFSTWLGRVADLGPEEDVVRLGGPPVLLCEADLMGSLDLMEPPDPPLSAAFMWEALYPDCLTFFINLATHICCSSAVVAISNISLEMVGSWLSLQGGMPSLRLPDAEVTCSL